MLFCETDVTYVAQVDFILNYRTVRCIFLFDPLQLQVRMLAPTTEDHEHGSKFSFVVSSAPIVSPPASVPRLPRDAVVSTSAPYKIEVEGLPADAEDEQDLFADVTQCLQETHRLLIDGADRQHLDHAIATLREKQHLLLAVLVQSEQHGRLLQQCDEAVSKCQARLGKQFSVMLPHHFSPDEDSDDDSLVDSEAEEEEVGPIQIHVNSSPNQASTSTSTSFPSTITAPSTSSLSPGHKQPSDTVMTPPAAPAPSPSSRSSASSESLEPSRRYDRWGMLKDSPDSKSDGETTAESAFTTGLRKLKRAVATRQKRDRARERKWRDMLADWPRTLRNRQEVVKRRARKGVPDSLRAKAWLAFAGASVDLSAERRDQPGLYVSLLQKESKFSYTIQKDVSRTFPRHILFLENKKGRSIGKEALYNVLNSYAIFDPEVGYCQGMGFIAGMLLMYMGEEDAFWLLHRLVRDPKYSTTGQKGDDLSGLWSPGFPLLHEFQFQFAELLKLQCPKAHKQMQQTEPPVGPMFYAPQWFITLFAYNLPMEFLVRLWDVMLFEGSSKIIFKTALYFIKSRERELSKADFQGTISLLKSVEETPILKDPDQAISEVLKVPLPRSKLRRLAAKHRRTLQQAPSSSDTTIKPARPQESG
eukprot:g30733.t1